MVVCTGAQPARSHKLAGMLRSWWILVGASAFLAAACLLDDDKCDANQVHETPGFLDYCQCAPGTIPDPKGYGCLPCGEHEVVQDTKCVCDDGYTRASPADACEVIMGQVIGEECSDNSSCNDPYPYCAADGPEHYCTQENCTNETCPNGYTCETVDSGKFCAKLPSGIGEPCTTNEDCTAFDANQCDGFNKKCVLGGCATGKVKCPSTWACCDLSAIVPGISVCGDPGAGMCPGKVVTP
jgi:hypothetical protein